MNSFNAPNQINAIDKMTTVKCKSVDLEGYVIIVVQTKDNKIKLYGKCQVISTMNTLINKNILALNFTLKIIRINTTTSCW